MADETPKGTKEEPSKDKPDAATNPDSKRTLLQIADDYIRRFATATTRSVSSLGNPTRLLLILVAGIVAAIVLLWIVDKVVFYYLARSYIDQVADAFDLNVHLANALVLFTFIVAVFLGRYIWSFSKQKRLIGIAGLSVLLIGHSLLLWYATRNSYFNRGGVALKCYVLTRDGKVTFGEHPGVDATTGRLCRPYTPDMLERLKEYAKGKRPQLIMEADPIFFDPRTGEPIVWYYRTKDNEIKIFDLMGFEPNTGDELLPISKNVVEEWKIQYAQLRRRVPKRVDPEKFVFFDPINGKPRAWYWRDSNGKYEFYDSPGFEPQTGDRLIVATREVVDAWKKDFVGHENVPQLVDPDTYSFFDPSTGAPRAWYWRGDNGVYEFYDAPGFHPRTGDKLLIVTRDVVEQWKQNEEKKKQDSDAAKKASELNRRTLEFVNTLYGLVSGPNNEVMTASNDIYADQVNYYGKPLSRQEVQAEWQTFMDRWPNRQYNVRQEFVDIGCDGLSLTCTAKGLLDFDDNSPARNARSTGTASFEYVLKFASVTAAPKIIQESGDVKVRNLEPLSDVTSPPSGYQTWNGCPPNWTIQGGVCKPYQGGQGQNAITPQQQVIQGVIGGVLQRLGR